MASFLSPSVNSVKGNKSVKGMNGDIAPPLENKNRALGTLRGIMERQYERGGEMLPATPFTPHLPLSPLTRAVDTQVVVKPVNWSTVYAPFADADPRFDDTAAEQRFQHLQADGAHTLLLEFESFVALEARCGELHGRLLDFPDDERLLALYDGYAAAWLLCRGL